MSTPYKQEFQEGVSLDTNESKIRQTQAALIKNMTANVNANPNSASGAGFNLGVYTPLEGNTALSISLPSGTNYCIGFYNSEQTNEGYGFIYNSSGQHCIIVLRGDTGVVQKVYQGALLGFVLDPEHFISEGRCVVVLRSYVDRSTGLESYFTFLIFAYNIGPQFCISVEDSIATNFFSTAFFTSSSAFYNPLELIHLGVPTPMKEIGINAPVAYVPTDEDKNKQNFLNNKATQFRIKQVQIFGRESEHGIISEQYVTVYGGGCIASSNGLPVCVMLNFDAGNPYVDKIQVEYRTWTGNDRSGALSSGWMVYETFDKYDNSAPVKWYNRSYNNLFITAGSGITFNVATNTISYTFCGNKNSIPLPQDETSRTQNSLPRISNSLFMVSNRLGLANNVRGFELPPQSMIDKVVFSSHIPTEVACDAPPTRTIKLYINIWCPYTDKSALIRQSYDKVVFGNTDNGDCNDTGGTSSLKLGQIFGDQGNPGFIVYLAGTPYKGVSVQGDFDHSTKIFTKVGYGAGIGDKFPNSCMQEITIPDVPAGKYVARVASHKAKTSDPDYQKTSTYVGGAIPLYNVTIPGNRAIDMANFPDKEIIIDCSAGDVTLNSPGDDMFLVLDLCDSGGAAAVDGYIYECPGGAPVEMTPVEITGKSAGGTLLDAYGSFFTDHNGFYFCTSVQHPTAQIWGDACDGGGFLAFSDLLMVGTANCIMHGKGTNSIPGHCWGDNGDWTPAGALYLFAAANSYPTGGRRIVKQYFGKCGTPTLGVPGIPTVMTKGPAAISDTSGKVSIIAHNRYSYASFIKVYNYALVPNYSVSPANKDDLIFSQKGGCQWTDCNGDNCDPFMNNQVIEYLGCNVDGTGCVSEGIILRTQFTISPVGSGYLVGDTVSIDSGTVLAIVRVTVVDGMGGVLRYKLLSRGKGYTLGTKTTTTITGVGTGMTVEIIRVDPDKRTFCAPDLFVNVGTIKSKGVQTGNTYPVAFILHDVINRHTAPIRRQGEKAFVQIPNLNDPGYQKFVLPSIRVDIDNTFAVNPIFTRLTCLIGSGIGFTDFISAPADWIQHVDNTGATNNSNPTNTRIYWPSLKEYNKLNNFNTNTSWEFLPGDVVQFIMNGNGDWIDSVVSAKVSYDQNGQFFTIDYLPELAGLKNNCLFRIVRPAKNESGDFVPLYEVAYTFDLVNGVPTVFSKVLPYADSYLISRTMPVPRMKGQPYAIPSSMFPATPSPIEYTSSNQNESLDKNGTSTGNSNPNGVVIFQAIDDTVSYPFYCEHHSPADTWGSHLADRGRTFFPDPYVRQKRIGTEIALSEQESDRNNLAAFNYFDIKNSKEFDRNVWGNITAVLVDNSKMLVICDSDHYLVTYNASNLRVSENGTVVGENTYGIFSAPQRKSGTNYGCTLFDINTISRTGGKVSWLDRSGYVVFHDFSIAKAVQFMGYDGYINNKVSKANLLNQNTGANGITYFHGRHDPKTWEYILTSFNIPVSGTPSYINNLSEINTAVNETLIIDLETGILKSMASFTGEYYGSMPGYYLQKNFISFKNGVPYIHHKGVNAALPYNNFYGVQCKKLVVLVVNIGNDKVKRFMWNEVYCKEHLFVALTIKTDRGQLSRLLSEQWDKREKFFAAAFLCDLNTPADPNIPVQTGANAIIDGNPLAGQWMKVSYSSLDADDAKYCELYGIVNYVIGIDPSAD